MMYNIKYTGNLSWLVPNTILYVRHGSHAYGLATPESDEDFKGVAIPPVEYYLGFVNRFDQAEIKSDNQDSVIYNIQKFFKLAADCNPNIIEVLWVNEEDQLIVTDAGRTILDHREKFLSKKALYTFSRYAMSQLKRIKRHRKWLLEPPTHAPTRQEFGLPEKPMMARNQIDTALSFISKQVDSWEMNLQDFTPAQRQFIMDLFEKILTQMSIGQNEKWKAAAGLMGFETNFLEVLEKEKQYKSARDNWKSFQNWKKNRNPTRAAMEAKSGYDAKHAQHLVRLYSMGEEILSTGQVIVKRPDRAELLAVRNGQWTYEELLEWTVAKEQKLREIAQTSSLPRQPDRDFLDSVCRRVIVDYHRR